MFATGLSEIRKISDLIEEYNLLFFDIWGVILENDSLYEGIADVINNIIKQKKVMFVSNSSRTKEPTCKKLFDCGLNVTNEMVMTAGEVAQKMFQEPKKYFGSDNLVIYNLGSEHSSELWSKYDFQVTKEINKANLLAISFNSFEKELAPEILQLFAKAIELKIPAICTNNDRIAPAGGGRILYCAGWFSEQFENMGGRVLYCGKPFTNIFLEALNMHPNVPKNQILMIGDTLGMDIKGAANIGINSALVLTGNTGFLMKNKQDKVAAIIEICSQNQLYPTHLVDLTL